MAVLQMRSPESRFPRFAATTGAAIDPVPLPSPANKIIARLTRDWRIHQLIPSRLALHLAGDRRSPRSGPPTAATGTRQRD
jgi:hypothetical protein